MKISCIAFIAATLLTISDAQAFSFKNLLGGKQETQQNPLNDSINKGINSIGGAGTADVLNGTVSPVVSLAAKQLGIPNQYVPQLQELYNHFKGGNTVSATDVNAKPGLSSWLSKKPNLDATGLASGLTKLFNNAYLIQDDIKF